MRKIGFRACGFLICVAACLSADSFSASDKEFFADKGEFPPTPDEGTLIETDMTTSSTDSGCSEGSVRPQVSEDASSPDE